jgi:toxin-antitoxin system PIN domain toxin
MLVDTNVWMALLLPSHPFHQVVREALATQWTLMLCNSVQISLMRLLTTPSVQRQYGTGTLSNSAVVQSLAALRAHPNVQVVTEPTDLYASWIQFAAHPTPAPKRWMDAYLAALAFHYAVPIITLDQGYAVFETHGVQVVLV